MVNEAILLRVTDASGCGVLRIGDRWIVSQREIAGLDGARICPHAVHQLYPHLSTWINNPQAARGTFTCESSECRAVLAIAPCGSVSPSTNETCKMQRTEGLAAVTDGNIHATSTFMSRLSPEMALEIVAVAGRRQGEPGTEFLAAGTRGERLLIVAEGQVEVVRASPDGHAETVLAVLGPGDCFGEMSLLTDQPTSAAVRARTLCTLFTLTRPQLERLLNNSPELARVFSQLLAERLRTLNRTLENELEHGMRGRLSTLPFSDLVQLLHAGRKTGTLVLSAHGCEARLSFQDGRLTAARTGALKGDEAFFAVTRWKDGEFRLESSSAQLPDDTHIGVDTMALLMEAMRRMDEDRPTPG
jgi:CRP-like cAMP-binding protein